MSKPKLNSLQRRYIKDWIQSDHYTSYYCMLLFLKRIKIISKDTFVNTLGTIDNNASSWHDAMLKYRNEQKHKQEFNSFYSTKPPKHLKSDTRYR